MLVEPEDVIKQYTKPLTPAQEARLPDDLATLQGILEAWARQKFEPTDIVDERHRVLGSPIFLKWGIADGPVQIKEGLKTNPSMEVDYPPNEHGSYLWFAVPHHPYIFVSYTVDVDRVEPYLADLKTIITRAAIAKLMRPDVVTFKVVNSYSVEGLSIQYNNGATNANGGYDKQAGDFDFQDLSGLAGLRRQLIV